MSENIGHCPLCGGDEQPGTTTFAVDLKFGVVVVTEVPVFAHHQLNLRELFLPERGYDLRASSTLGGKPA